MKVTWSWSLSVVAVVVACAVFSRGPIGPEAIMPLDGTGPRKEVAGPVLQLLLGSAGEVAADFFQRFAARFW